MGSSNGGERSSRNPSSPALSAHAVGDANAEKFSSGFQDSRFNLLSGTPPYQETRSDVELTGKGLIDGKRPDPLDPLAGQKLEVIDRQKISGTRKRWLFFVWLLTWWIPPFVIGWIVRTKRIDVRSAWREKLAINMLIWLGCAAVMFFMIGFPELICPRQDVFSYAEIAAFDGKGHNKAYIAMRGIVYDLGSFAPRHYPPIVPKSSVLKYAGRDATNLFPIQVSALCTGTSGAIDPAVQLDYQNTNYSSMDTLVSTSDLNARYHDFRWFTNDSRPDWWWEQQYTLKNNYMKGKVGYTPAYIATLANKQNYIAHMYGKVYDMTAYIIGGRVPQFPVGEQPPDTLPSSDFMDDQVVGLFRGQSGSDVTKYWESLSMSAAEKSAQKVCLDNLFYVGDLDTRNSTQCLFAKYLLLSISILLVSVICFKFLAALQFGKKNVPENLDKFVICQIPAYTEDEDSLRRAIDSAARMKYDDKRKLLVIICDGVIVGQGNDRSTPRIVLDILGVSETIDPDPLSFESLGNGEKQHNMGKVFSGLYEVQGHIVPFLVVVKVGNPKETQRPGNRGKRDSQMVLMRFLNRIHYNMPMTPMELEMHHQIRNIIGVQPTFYEYCLQIDADTVVAPDSATRMVSAFMQDTRLIGVCGETALTNAKASMVTMIQVYEYYISHNLTKAFESLFGSVTCLPGCFSMYRIRAQDSGKPLFVSKEVVEGYAENRVDTLHMKNLLHLGEDRYLTTLLLKHHRAYKTKYIFRAHAWTIAPDSWSIFLSQRRRWINSTVHNLVELMPLAQLCGFCCFSMRFVVFLDLLSTIVQPVLMGYIGYLIYLLVTSTSVIPLTAFILLGAIYGLQAVIFIARRKWEMVGWMIVYIFATPVFSFALPLYAFWHMDDFSWGNTRIVTGEKGQKLILSDEGAFDPNSIPKKRWEEYQAELWEMHSQYQADGMSAAGAGWRDDRSEASAASYGAKSAAAAVAAANYSRAASRAASRTGSMVDMPRANPRVSLAPTAYGALTGGEDPSAPPSTVGGAAAATTTGASTPGESSSVVAGGELPSEDMLLREIRNMLASADVMQVTHRNVKAELERRFGCNLRPRKEYIKAATQAVMNGEL